jgi:hypothetical protein
MTTPASSCDRVSLAPVANEMGFRCGRQTFFSLRPDVLILSCGMMALWGVVARCQIRKRRKGCVCELKPILFGVSRARRLDLTPVLFLLLRYGTLAGKCTHVQAQTVGWSVRCGPFLPSSSHIQPFNSALSCRYVCSSVKPLISAIWDAHRILLLLLLLLLLVPPYMTTEKKHAFRKTQPDPTLSALLACLLYLLPPPQVDTLIPCISGVVS